VFEGELGYFYSGAKLALAVDLDSINGGIKFSILVSLGDSNISPVSSDRHDSYGVLRVLLELHLAEGLGCFLL